jgi:hypothetical protein
MSSNNKYRLVHERSYIIPISPSSPNNKLEKAKEYSLKENFFDPSKSSPPNEFMQKLQHRINIYKTFSINEDNLDIE